MSAYKTRRQQRRDRRRMIVRNSLIIILLLTFLGSAGFVYISYKHDIKLSLLKIDPRVIIPPRILKQKKPLKRPVTSPAPVVKKETTDTVVASSPTLATLESQNEEIYASPTILQKIDDNEKANPITKENKPSARKAGAEIEKLPVVNEAAVIVKDTVAEELPKPVTKTLNEEAMADILLKIKSEKARTNNTSNCVQIQKTRDSNVENAFSIAKYLHDHGFIISGRLTVPQEFEGVRVDAKSSCIRLTIGRL